MRRQALLPTLPSLTAPRTRSATATATPDSEAAAPLYGPVERRLVSRLALIAGLATLALAAGLLLLRATHADRVYPAVYVADVPVGGQTIPDATNLIAARAATLEAQPVSFAHGGQTWTASLSQLGLTVDTAGSAAAAFDVGREPGALERTGTTLGLVRGDEHLPLRMAFDEKALGSGFDQIDRELGAPPHDAYLQVSGTAVSVVPEQDGTVVDRPAATAAIMAGLRQLAGTDASLPTIAKSARVRAGDLAAAQASLTQSLANPVQVTYGNGRWTVPGADAGTFFEQSVDPARSGADAVRLSLDQVKLSAYLSSMLGPEINRDPVNAQVGWNGERVVSVVESVDGTRLQADKLAGLVAQSFFGDHKAVEAPVTVTAPEIDSNNLAKLGITTLLGSGSSNYAGSAGGRATNIGVGANLLNGTLVPPHGTFSFNNAIGLIDEEKGYVEAQVISGESIGKDIGGGICQVSTTVFRAAYLAGLPITEWWPHRFRIGFYELDGWPLGLDASILQPSDDPSTWGDFKFENPSDKWMLVESWSDGAHVIVNIYGADLGYKVESVGPTVGQKYQMLADDEEVDAKLEPGTINQTMSAGVGEEVTYYRTVYDRDGNVLWERSFYTKFYPKGNVWEVSPDMAGKSPSDPGRALPPLASDPPASPPDVSWSGAGVAEDGVPSFGSDNSGGQSAATDDGSGSAALAGNGGAPAA